MDYLLYKLSAGAKDEQWGGKPSVDGTVEVFSPFSISRFLPVVRVGGVEYVKAIIVAAWAVLFGGVRFRDQRVWVYAAANGGILHFSVVGPAALHMPWLVEAGLEIGTCYTVPAARGKKIYPYVLKTISLQNRGATGIYMIVEADNAASRAGMERAGFTMLRKLRRKSGIVRPAMYLAND